MSNAHQDPASSGSSLPLWLRTVAVWGLTAGLVGYFVYATISAVRQGRHKDFREFWLAAEAMRRGRDIYAVGVDGYIYPPLLAFLLMPLVPMGLIAATYVWLASNVVLLLGSLLIGARVLRERLSLPHRALLVPGAAALAMLLNADKLHVEFVFGQSNLWLMTAWVLGLVWLDRRPVAAGVVLGLAANIKYLSLGLVPYMLLRRRWRAAAATVASTVAWGLLPAAYLGWDGNLACWAKALRGLVGMVDRTTALAAGMPAARVIDIKGGLSMSITSWAVRATSSGAPNVASVFVLGTVLVIVVACVVFIYRRAGVSLIGRAGEHGPGVVALEWVGVLAAILAFGPQTNSRHLSMLSLVLVAGLVLGLSRGVRVARWPVWVGLAVLTAGLTLPPGYHGLREALAWWRWVGGVSWCLVFMELTVVWVGLRHAAGAAGATDPEPGN